MNEYEQNILQNIDEHGWFCSMVFDPDGEEPSFAYSVGFAETLAVPECIVFGLDQKLMHSMLWEMFRQLKAGKRMEDGTRWGDLLQGFDCISRPVHPSNIKREYLNSAMWYWGDPKEMGPLQVYQLVWPSATTGLFPWDEGCAQEVRDLQPPLYLPTVH